MHTSLHALLVISTPLAAFPGAGEGSLAPRHLDASAEGAESVCCLPIPPELLGSPGAVRALGGADPVTVVLDFKAPGRPNTFDIFGFEIATLDVTDYGFAASDFDDVVQSVYCAVLSDVFGIPASDVVPGSPMPPLEELDLAVVIGEIGVPPSNGASEYYYIQIGSGVGAGPLGVAGLNTVRDENGNPSTIRNGSIVASVFTDNINGLSNLSPANALTSGNLDFTTNAIAGTTSHELGHTVSLLHLNVAASLTPTGLDPLMATGAIDLPNQARIFDREFAISGFNNQDGGAAQFHVQQLIGALDTRPATNPSCDPPQCLTFCSALPNATLSPAALSCSGDPNSDLVLVSTPVPDTTGQFFYGPQMLGGATSLGDGLRCVGGMTTRLLPLVSAGMMMQAPNTAAITINYSAPYAAGLVGTQYFQYWFRSGLATGTGSNTSDGLEITF